MTVNVLLLDPNDHTDLYLSEYVRDGALVCMPRPNGRRAFALHRDVLAAMGCRSDVRTATARSAVGRDLLLVQAWTAAHAFRHVYVCHADFVHHPRWFTDLADAFARAGAATHLVCDNTVTGKVLDWADEHDHTISTAAPVLPPPSVVVDDEADGQVVFPQMLPDADFYLWLARCRDLLPAAEYRTVHALYVSVLHEWVTEPPTSRGEAVTRLLGLVQERRSQGEVLTCVRAAQAACFRHGMLLRLKLVHLLATVQDQEHRRLTGGELRALRAYREPWIGTAVALRDAGLTTRQVTALTVGDVRDDGRLLDSVDGPVPVTGEAVTFVRALCAVRELDGARPGDPLVPRPARDITDAIRWARTDLNLPGVTRAHDGKDADWRDRMKLTLHDLATGAAL